MITLKSSDGQEFLVEKLVALEFQNIKHIIEDEREADNAISIPNVTGRILEKIIDYCRNHVDEKKSDDDLKELDADFVRVERSILINLCQAARGMNISSLFDLICLIARLMEGLTLPEMREMLNVNIVNDSTIEEAEEKNPERVPLGF